MRDATLTTWITSPMHTYFNPRVPCGTRLVNLFCYRFGIGISIHASHAGRDALVSVIFDCIIFISIHASHAGRDQFGNNDPIAIDISIHASHAGRDYITGLIVAGVFKFQSTRPMRDATSASGAVALLIYFNPRVPCGTRLAYSLSCRCYHIHFNPRVPCGTRQRRAWAHLSRLIFQSTRPMRDATKMP